MRRTSVVLLTANKQSVSQVSIEVLWLWKESQVCKRPVKSVFVQAGREGSVGG